MGAASCSTVGSPLLCAARPSDDASGEVKHFKDCSLLPLLATKAKFLDEDAALDMHILVDDTLCFESSNKLHLGDVSDCGSTHVRLPPSIAKAGKSEEIRSVCTSLEATHVLHDESNSALQTISKERLGVICPAQQHGRSARNAASEGDSKSNHVSSLLAEARHVKKVPQTSLESFDAIPAVSQAGSDEHLDSTCSEQQAEPALANAPPDVDSKEAKVPTAAVDKASKVECQPSEVKSKVRVKAGSRRPHSERQAGTTSNSGKREPRATTVGKTVPVKGRSAGSTASVHQEELPSHGALNSRGSLDGENKQLDVARNDDAQRRLTEIEEARLLSVAEREDEERQLEMGRHTQKASFGSSLLSRMSRQPAVVAEIDPDQPLQAGARHFVKKTPMFPPWPTGLQQAMFGMGCFWCAENVFMRAKGVFSTQVGFAGGKMIQPNYDAVSLDASFAKTGETGKIDHAEVVRIVFNPAEISYDSLLKLFWERHDPTQGNRQGRDEGYQYRSLIGCYGSAQKAAATLTLEDFQLCLRQKGISRKITTEILCPAPHFWYAEEVHQQYDAKPNSRPYCGLSPTGARLS